MRAFLLILSMAALASAQDSLPLSLKRAVEIALAPEGNTDVLAIQRLGTANVLRFSSTTALRRVLPIRVEPPG